MNAATSSTAQTSAQETALHHSEQGESTARDLPIADADAERMLSLLKDIPPMEQAKVLMKEIKNEVAQEGEKYGTVAAGIVAGESPEAQSQVAAVRSDANAKRVALQTKAESLAKRVTEVVPPTESDVEAGVKQKRTDAIAGLRNPGLMPLELVHYVVHDPDFRKGVVDELKRLEGTHQQVPAEVARYGMLARVADDPQAFLKHVQEGKKKLLAEQASPAGENAKKLQAQIQSLEALAAETSEPPSAEVAPTVAAPVTSAPESVAPPVAEASSMTTEDDGPEIEIIEDEPVPEVTAKATSEELASHQALVEGLTPPPAVDETIPVVYEAPKDVVPDLKPVLEAVDVEKWSREAAQVAENGKAAQAAVMNLRRNDFTTEEGYAKALAAFTAYKLLNQKEQEEVGTELAIAEAQKKEAQLLVLARTASEEAATKKQALETAHLNASAVTAIEGGDEALKNELAQAEQKAQAARTALEAHQSNLLHLGETRTTIQAEKQRLEQEYAAKETERSTYHEPSKFERGLTEGVVATGAGIGGVAIETASVLTKGAVGTLSGGSRFFFWLARKLDTGGKQSRLMNWIGEKMTGMNEDQRRKYLKEEEKRMSYIGAGYSEGGEGLDPEKKNKKVMEFGGKLGFSVDQTKSLVTIEDDGDMFIEGGLEVTKPDLESFPKGLKFVKGDVDLSACEELRDVRGLPKRIEGDLNLAGTQVTELPEELELEGAVVMNASQTALLAQARRLKLRYKVLGAPAEPGTPT